MSNRGKGFFSKNFWQAVNPARRQEMIDRNYGKLNIIRQCVILGYRRSNFYHAPHGKIVENYA
jgi:hypothetical protein